MRRFFPFHVDTRKTTGQKALTLHIFSRGRNPFESWPAAEMGDYAVDNKTHARRLRRGMRGVVKGAKGRRF